MTPYSLDLRERVLGACDAGADAAEVAETFSVSVSWVRRLRQRRRDAGGAGIPAPKSSRNTRVRKLAGHADRIRALIAATPGLTLAEIRRELGVTVALATVWAAVAGLGLTVKKKSAGRPSRTART
jgi:transposase